MTGGSCNWLGAGRITVFLVAVAAEKANEVCIECVERFPLLFSENETDFLFPEPHLYGQRGLCVRVIGTKKVSVSASAPAEVFLRVENVRLGGAQWRSGVRFVACCVYSFLGCDEGNFQLRTKWR